MFTLPWLDTRWQAFPCGYLSITAQRKLNKGRADWKLQTCVKWQVVGRTYVRSSLKPSLHLESGVGRKACYLTAKWVLSK